MKSQLILLFLLLSKVVSAQSLAGSIEIDKLLDSLINIPFTTSASFDESVFKSDTIRGFGYQRLLVEGELTSSCYSNIESWDLDNSFISYNEYQLDNKLVYKIRVISIVSDSTNKKQSYFPVSGLKVIAYFDSIRITNYTNKEGIIEYFEEKPNNLKLYFLPGFPVKEIKLDDDVNSMIISYSNNELISELKSKFPLIKKREILVEEIIRERRLREKERVDKLKRSLKH